VHIVEASDADLEAVLAVSRAAFDGEDVPALVRDLLDDPSACPLLSLIARDGGRIVGHALFTAARVGTEDAPVSSVILAPLAVVPNAQRQGVGGLLLQTSLPLLGVSGIRLVFLAGYPDYYTRHGFEPAYPRIHTAVPGVSHGGMDGALTPTGCARCDGRSRDLRDCVEQG
jgi:putative acetyltransferase